MNIKSVDKSENSVNGFFLCIKLGAINEEFCLQIKKLLLIKFKVNLGKKDVKADKRGNKFKYLEENFEHSVENL